MVHGITGNTRNGWHGAAKQASMISKISAQGLLTTGNKPRRGSMTLVDIVWRRSASHRPIYATLNLRLASAPGMKVRSKFEIRGWGSDHVERQTDFAQTCANMNKHRATSFHQANENCQKHCHTKAPRREINFPGLLISGHRCEEIQREYG